MRKKYGILFLAACLLLLTGCLKSTEDLYALPKQSDEYQELQQAISAVLSPDAEYSAPISGSNRQAIQLADLDGDGENEAIAFLKTTGEMPLKAYIFKSVDGSYQNSAIIEGNGSSFQSVEYLQLDGAGGQELVIGWQVSNQVTKAVSVYSLRPDGMIELMNASCTEYRSVDMEGDGRSELFLLRFNAEEQTGVAELYSYRDGALERQPEAQLSQGISAIKRIITGFVTENVPAVFVASSYDESHIVTDVFAVRDGVFQNIASRNENGMASTVRDYFVYAADVDSDGLIELPNPVPLMPTTESTTSYWAIEWYNLNLEGERIKKLRTYHNFQASGGWYLELPDEWRSLVIYRGNNVGSVAGYVFAIWNERGESEELFTIYAFTGSRRGELAESDGRFALGQKGETTYAASLGAKRDDLTEERLRRLFHFIKIDWNTGET